ncbi:MAG: hypothetical protein WC455_12180 [Dehalococcoidia bacterium]
MTMRNPFTIHFWIVLATAVAMAVTGWLAEWYWGVIPAFMTLLGYCMLGYATCGKGKR